MWNLLEEEKKQLWYPECSTACQYKAWLICPLDESATELSLLTVPETYDAKKSVKITESSDKNSISTKSKSPDVCPSTVDDKILFSDGECVRSNRLSFHNPTDYIFMHNADGLSGKYNFEGYRFSLDTNLNIDYYRFMLLDYPDIYLCDLLEFGFPIDYMGKTQQQPRDSFDFVRIIKVRRNLQFTFRSLKKKKKQLEIRCHFRSNSEKSF